MKSSHCRNEEGTTLTYLTMTVTPSQPESSRHVNQAYNVVEQTVNPQPGPGGVVDGSTFDGRPQQAVWSELASARRLVALS